MMLVIKELQLKAVIGELSREGRKRAKARLNREAGVGTVPRGTSSPDEMIKTKKEMTEKPLHGSKL